MKHLQRWYFFIHRQRRYLRIVVLLVLCMTSFSIWIRNHERSQEEPTRNNHVVNDVYSKRVESLVNVRHKGNNHGETEVLKNLKTKSKLLNMTEASMAEKCDALGITRQDIKVDNFYIDRRNDLIYCAVFKAGFTTLSYTFLRLHGIMDPDKEWKKRRLSSNHELFGKEFPPPSTLHDLDMYLDTHPSAVSFMVSRHPFERLASAYWDKVGIVLKKKSGYIWSIVREIQTTLVKAQRNRKFGKLISFKEFVEFLLMKGPNTNIHWTPISLLCSPCTFQFTRFIRMETFNEDVNELIADLHLQFPFNGTRANVGRVENVSWTTLFKELTANDIQGLIQMYKLDFLLFNYPIPDPHDILASNF